MSNTTTPTIDRPFLTLNQASIRAAMQTLADINGLEENDPAICFLKEPVWASKIVQAYCTPEEYGESSMRVPLTPDLADYAEDQCGWTSATDDKAETVSANWESDVASAYNRYFADILRAFPLSEVTISDDEAAVLAELPLAPITSFDHFISRRRFRDAQNLVQDLRKVAAENGATGYCVTYPGNLVIAYDPASGRGKISRETGSVDLDLELLERKLYAFTARSVSDRAASLMRPGKESKS
jgi:hypothetical protein